MPVQQGWNVSYSIYVQNSGPDTARDVTMTDVLPAGVTFLYAYTPTGTCNTPPSGEIGTVTCSLGDIEPNQGVVLYIDGTSARPRQTLENTATASSTTDRLQSANNSATVTTEVVAPPPPPANDNFADAER